MEALQRLHNRGSISTGYDIDNSVKLEYANSEGFSFTNGSTGNGQTWTVSYWFKRTSVGEVFDIGFGASGGLEVGFFPAGEFYFYNSGYLWKSNALYRDTSAWYHVVVSIDTTQGTAANRIRVYINGEEVTSLATDAPPSQNTVLKWNVTGNTYYIGYWPFANYYSKGYYADFHSVDGQQLAPTAFGEFDEDSGIWKPKAYEGSYGTNGFKLEFKDSADLAADTSGNSKTISANNITSADQATDTPTNNFCTFNPLVRVNNTPTITEGGTKVIGGGGTWNQAFGTLGAKKGKWYYEVKIANSGDTAFYGASTFPAEGDNVSSGQLMYNTSFMVGSVASPDYYYWQNGSQVSNESTGWGSIAQNDVVGIALDLDASTKTFTIYKNGTALSGTLSQPVDLPTNMQDEFIFPMVVQYEDSGDQYNLGGYTIMTISSAASDENGYGTFEYAPPSGYYALCTKNLEEFG